MNHSIHALVYQCMRTGQPQNTHLSKLGADGLRRQREHVGDVCMRLEHVLEHHGSELLLRCSLQHERPRRPEQPIKAGQIAVGVHELPRIQLLLLLFVNFMASYRFVSQSRFSA
jgi:hypothetical protein